MNTRIVIAGGGFAGLYAAMHLDKTLARGTEVEVGLGLGNSSSEERASG